MDAFVMEIAGVAFQVIPLYETTRFYCRDYLTDREPEYMIRVQPEYLGLEQLLLDWEADEEGLKRRKSRNPFWSVHSFSAVWQKCCWSGV